MTPFVFETGFHIVRLTFNFWSSCLFKPVSCLHGADGWTQGLMYSGQVLYHGHPRISCMLGRYSIMNIPGLMSTSQSRVIPNQRRQFRTLQQVFIFALYLLQCLKPKEIHFLFKFGCVYKYHLSGLSTLNAMVSWPISALKSSFVCLPRGPENMKK